MRISDINHVVEPVAASISEQAEAVMLCPNPLD